MASNYTEHYQLPLWEPEDAFLREEFNEANRKIDGALGRLGIQLNQCPILITGTYFGTGEEQNTHLSEMEAVPHFLLVLSHNATEAWRCIVIGTFGLFKAGGDSTGRSVKIELSTHGLFITGATAVQAMNQEYTQYSYMALC